MVPSTMEITHGLLKKCPISLRPAKLRPIYETTHKPIPAHCKGKGRSPIKLTAMPMVKRGAKARMVAEMLRGMWAMAL